MKTWQDLTDMIQPNDVGSEMVKKYKNTILGIRTKHKTFYAKYQGISENKTHVFTDFNGMRVELKQDTNVGVFIPIIKRGLYNTQQGVVCVTRSPYRQYRRGVCGENTIITTLKGIVSQYENNLFDTYISDVFEANYYQMEKALGLLPDVGSVALTSEFALQLHHHKEKGIALFYYENYIGEVHDKQILLKNNLFLQEVLDTRNEWCPKNYVISME